MITHGQLYQRPLANRPPSEYHTIRFWKVEEAVGGGKYIVWPGSCNTKKVAEDSIPERLRDTCRAVEYQQGRGYGKGPERVNP